MLWVLPLTVMAEQLSSIQHLTRKTTVVPSLRPFAALDSRWLSSAQVELSFPPFQENRYKEADECFVDQLSFFFFFFSLTSSRGSLLGKCLEPRLNSHHGASLARIESWLLRPFRYVGGQDYRFWYAFFSLLWINAFMIAFGQRTPWIYLTCESFDWSVTA